MSDSMTCRPRLLLVAPYVDEPGMIQALEQGLGVVVQQQVFRTSKTVAAGVWRRHLNIWRSAWAAFRQRNQVRFIVFGEQFIGLYYALLTRLLGRGRGGGPRTIVLQLIYNRRPGWKGAWYRAVYGWLIGSPALTRLVCAASFERSWYAEEFGAEVGSKLVFLPFGRNTPWQDDPCSPASPDRGAPFPPFFFTGGTSNRDYATLIEAFRGLPWQLQIACYPADVAGLAIPPNVQVLHGVFDDDFKRKVHDCLAVIIPIKSARVSAGQLVLLDAMRVGKASIVTAGSCMEDYADGSTALRVPVGDVQALRQAVTALAGDDGTLRARLGQASRERYDREFTRQAFGQRIARALQG